MKWTVEYSADAVEFIDREDLSGQVREQIALFLKKMRGQAVNLDAKKLKGKWKGYFRIRKGRLRIIFSVQFDLRVIYIERVDFRGQAYK
ncbi:MAG: hypothetical protein WCA08_20010 [Desulfoferrobacter sp.]